MPCILFGSFFVYTYRRYRSILSIKPPPVEGALQREQDPGLAGLTRAR